MATGALADRGFNHSDQVFDFPEQFVVAEDSYAVQRLALQIKILFHSSVAELPSNMASQNDATNPSGKRKADPSPPFASTPAWQAGALPTC